MFSLPNTPIILESSGSATLLPTESQTSGLGFHFRILEQITSLGLGYLIFVAVLELPILQNSCENELNITVRTYIQIK